MIGSAAGPPRAGHRSRVAESVLVVAVLALAATAFWLGGFVSRWDPSRSDWVSLDLDAYFYPKFTYGAQELARGRIPLWNPLEFCGMPFLAATQVAALYPVKNLLFWLFSPPHALNANYVVHLVLAGVFQYAYVRWLGLGAPAAAVAAVIWAFNANFVAAVYQVNRVMGLAWTPLILLLHERALERRTVGAAALAGAAVALQFNAGYPSFSLCMAVFLGLATVFRLGRALRAGEPLGRLIAAAAGVAAFGFAFAAPVLLPLGELLGQTSRTSVAEEWSARFERPTAGDAPTIAGVVVAAAGNLVFSAGPAAAFALGGVLLGRHPVRWFLVAALILLNAAGTVLAPLLRATPGFGLMRVSALLWVMFSPVFVGALAALGFERMTGRDPTARPIGALAVAVVFALGGWAAWRAPALVPLAALAALFGVLGLLTAGRHWLAGGIGAAVGAAILLLAVANVPYRTGAVPYPSTTGTPETDALRAAANGGRVFAPALVRWGEHMLSRVPVVTGYEGSLHPERVGRLLDTLGLRDGLMGAAPDWDSVARHRPLLDLLGVSLLATPEVGSRLPDLVAGPKLLGGNTFRNPTVLDRAFVVHRVRSVADAESAFDAVIDPAFRPREEAVVEGPPPAVAAAEGAERVTLVRDRPEHVTLDATLSAPGLLVLADSFFPGWQASVDGRPAEILRTNYAFRGVALPAGTHRVEFRYRPRAFYAGVALAAVAALAALVARRRRWRRA